MSVASSVGLSSGIDYSSLISQLRQADSRPIYLAQAEQSKLQTRDQALSIVQGKIKEFQDSVAAIGSRDAFTSLTTSVSDLSILGASSTSKAATGSFNVRVRQLAQASRIASQGVATLNSTSVATGDGVFEFQVGTGTTHSVAVKAGMNLQDLADAINSLDSTGVRASIINDGSASNPYRLVLNAKDTGADSMIKIVNNDTTMNLTSTTIETATADKNNTFDGTVTTSGTYTGTQTRNILVEMTTAGAVGAAKYKVSLDGGLTWSANDAYTASATATDLSGGEGVKIDFGAGTQSFAVGDRFSFDAFAPVLQEARDAVVDVDGIQIRRASNTFENVVEGITFTAKKVSDDLQTVTTANNTTTLNTKIKSFVDSYNAVTDVIKLQTSYNAETKQGAALFGDSSVTSLLNSMRSQMTSLVSGVDPFKSLSDVGIRMGRSGKFEIDTTKLNDALKNNPDGVAQLFIQSGRSTSSAIEFTDSTAATATGVVSVNITQPAEKATVTGARVLESSGLAAAEKLTIVYGDNETVSFQLNAGDTLEKIVDTINAGLSDKGLAALASINDGKLSIGTTAYGSEERLRVSSDQDAAAAGQLGIGTAVLEGKGKDVAGTLNGIAAKGEGQKLLGQKGSTTEGLQLNITATAPMSSTLTLTRGIAAQMQKQLDGILDSDDGLFVTRSKSIQSQIKSIDERIESMSARLDKQEEAMRARFNALEQQLASMQTQGNYLQAQLASLIG